MTNLKYLKTSVSRAVSLSFGMTVPLNGGLVYYNTIS